MTENWYFAVIDAPGELLTIEQDEEVIVIIENDMVYSMLDINAELYCKYVIIGKNSKKTLVRLPQQGYVHKAGGGTYSLPKTAKIFKGIWINHQPIQSLIGKQVDGRSKTNSGLAPR